MRPYFERGGVQLFHADARDAIDLVLVNGTVDLLLTDPPYGMQYESQGPVALKREREAGAGVLSRGLGANVGSVSAALQRLLDAGRVVLVRTEGQARIYALVENADRRQGSR